MPAYRWNSSTSQWNAITGRSMDMTGPNFWVKTSGTDTAVTTSNSRRLRYIYTHDGTGWKIGYRGWLPAPPATPATPTLSTSTSWNANVDQTSLQWTAIAVPSGATTMKYELETYNSKDSTQPQAAPLKEYSSGTTATGLFSIPIGGSRYYRVRAVANNEGGIPTAGGWSNWIGVKSGGVNAWSATTNNLSLLSSWDFYVGTGSSSDYQYKSGVTYAERDEVIILRNYPYTTTAQVSLAGPGFEDPSWQVFTLYSDLSGVRFYVYPSTFGRFRIVINPASGWVSGETIKMTWTGTINGTNTTI